MKKIIVIIAVLASMILIATSCTSTDRKDEVIPAHTEQEKISDSTPEESSEVMESRQEYALLYQPPEGGHPQNKGKIIFSSKYLEGEQNNRDFLYVMEADGTNLVRLLDQGQSMLQPAWSPEYSRIAYSARVSNQFKIFIMSEDGSVHKQLTYGDGDDKFPTWSPDGNHIAYISYIENVPNLFIIDIYGENKKQLTFAEEGDAVLWPHFSPVNDLIAYTYNQAGGEIGARIYTIRSDGTQMLEFMEPSAPRKHFSHPGWCPEGKTLYFISNDQSSHTEVWKIDYDRVVHNLSAPEGEQFEDIGLVKLTNLVSIGAAATYRPRVSPDGRKIVFSGGIPTVEPSGYNLITINIDGSNPTNLTSDISEACNWPDW